MAVPSNLFVYGTLRVPEIWNLVTGSFEPPRRDATLDDFAIRTVKDYTFPAIVRAEGESVPGEVLFDLPREVLDRLDAYEDAFYERNLVTVRPEEGPAIEAFAYETPPELAPRILSDTVWTLEWFVEQAFAEYWARMTGT